MANPNPADPAASTPYVGRAIDRVDGRLKVTGGARYAAEFTWPGLAHAVFVPAAIARGRVQTLDTSRAERATGVIAVITSLNRPALARPSAPPSGDSAALLDREVRYSGQIIAVVVAETMEEAEYAAGQLRVEYATRPPVVELEPELARGFPPNTGNVPARSQRGNFGAAIATATDTVDAVYRTPAVHHNPMEPHATVAIWRGDELTVYDATQGVTNTAQNLAEQFGLDPEQVHVIDPFVGGGFGCKGQSWPHTALTALAARMVKRPVRAALTRRQMFFTVGHRPETRQAEILGADGDGRLLALSHHAFNHTSEHDEFLEPTGSTPSNLYSCANVDISHQLVRLNVGSPTYQRAPGESTGNFAHETAMDELAARLRIDPLELRLRNYAETDEQAGRPWSSKSLRECYARGAARFGWSSRNPEPRSMRDGRWLVGYGMATASYPANFRPASAKAVMSADGSVRILCGTQDLGTGTYTILSQIAADTLGVPLGRVRVEIADSRLPAAPASGGSCSATSAGSAVMLAAKALRTRVLALAQVDPESALWNVPLAEIATEEGIARAQADPTRRMSYADILRRYGKQSVEQQAFAEPGRERDASADGSHAKAKPGTYSMQGFGAQFCEVRVDPALGIVRVVRWSAAFALGKVLNARTLRSQLQGGIVWGIGMALLESSLMDPHYGRYVNSNLSEYHVPVNADVPAIDIEVVEEEDELVSPLGAKGAGEIGITGSPAAIGNAIYHATGLRIRELPITLDKLLRST